MVPYQNWEALRFQLFRGETLLQDGDPLLMIFKPEPLVATINRTLPLVKGDLLYSGTPAGVGPILVPDQLRLVCAPLGLDFSITIEG